MMQKPWFKIFIWFMATTFFFLAAGVVISEMRPGPSEIEVMNFMTGMMSAMDRSMMGVAMNIEKDGTLQSVIVLSTSIALPLILAGLIGGIATRLWYRRAKDV